MQHYQVVVLGSGVAGQKVAKACAIAGQKVAIIDHQGFGGTCSQRGCDPKRELMASLEAVAQARQLCGKGLSGHVDVAWEDAQLFMRSFTADIPKKTERKLKEQGIDCYQGHAAFIARDCLSFGEKRISADHFVLATGMVSSPLPIAGQELLCDATDFLYMDALPESVLFVGAGYIALEFANMMAIAGVPVTVLERSDRILPGFDDDLAAAVQKSSEAAGVRFVLQADLQSAIKNPKDITVHYTVNGKRHQRSAARVFNASGRKPALELLNLHIAGIAYDKSGVKVNDFLQSTTNAKVYACGDVSDRGLPLTPLSSIEGDLVAFNLTNGRRKKLNLPKTTPTVVFSQPAAAAVGLTESAARKQGYSIELKTMDAKEWFMARHEAAAAYWFKIVVDAKSNHILGAHIHGPNAGETINIFALAINYNIKADHLRQNMIFTYPSWSGDVANMLQ